MEPAISIRNLSKRYQISQTRGAINQTRRIGDGISLAVRHPVQALRGAMTHKEWFWALKDINLDVEKGDVLGVIGRNGAGKSTLLKVLSQITYPTEGEVVLRGRVGSLLEVGTGFHPDLTGRENIFLNGAILGMTKKEITNKFDQIVKFAEVEKFLDTPIKRYSSGMYLRLAFAVAAHLEPDILIADEVLAVGDQQFQNKCLGRMREISEEGRTVIFVSHNMHAIRFLCDNGVYLKAGQVSRMGTVDEVINAYAIDLEGTDGLLPVETKELTIHGFDMVQSGAATGLIDGTRPFKVSIQFDLLKDIEGLRMGMVVHTPMGDELVRSLFSDWDTKAERMGTGTYTATLEFPEKLLVPGNYTMVLYAKVHGSYDILTGHRIERTVSVSAPLDFNMGGPADPLQAQIILDRKWSVNKE